MTINVLYEDEKVLAISKSSGELVIPGRGASSGEPLILQAEKYTGKKIFVVHRLDQGASGVLLFAKDAAAHRMLSMQFESRDVRKIYKVLVQGKLDSGGQIDKPLQLFGSGRMGVHPEGKPSMTDYDVLESLGGSTLLKVTPRTGRRHQIRVHFYAIGHPVMGDPLYGKDRPVGGVLRLMLHAQSLELTHPNGQPLALQCDPPKDFEDALVLLRR